MDEQILTHEFAAAVRAEPPLGFDPDEVITRTARRRRGRRNVLLAGAGVAVVALAAAALPLTHTSAQVPPAAPRTSTPLPPPADRLWPPVGVDVPQPTDDQLKARVPEVAGRVEQLLPSVVAGPVRRETADSGRFGGLMTSVLGVRTTEHVGPDGGGYYVTVEVFVPAAPVTRFQPKQLCAELKKQVSASTTCHYRDDDLGGILMTTEDDTLDRENTMQHGMTVTNFRADGTYVLATAGNAIGTSAAPPLTIPQLMTLATFPALTL